MKRNLLLAFALFLLVGLIPFVASCGKQVLQNESEEVSQSDRSTESAQPQKETGQVAEPVEETEPAPIDVAFVVEPIYFEFDSSALSDRAPAVLTKIAAHLRTYPDSEAIAQGHCDERGSDAYNLALGMRRAESVKIFLVQQGISADRLETVSYGKTRPVANGQDETAWAKNRRVEFLIN